MRARRRPLNYHYKERRNLILEIDPSGESSFYGPTRESPHSSEFLDADFWGGPAYQQQWVREWDAHCERVGDENKGCKSDFVAQIDLLISELYIKDPYLPMTNGGLDTLDGDLDVYLPRLCRERGTLGLTGGDSYIAYKEEETYKYLESIYGFRHGRTFQDALYKARCFDYHMCQLGYNSNVMCKALSSFKTKEDKRILPMIVEFFKACGKNKTRCLLKALKLLEIETGEKNAILKRRLRNALKQETFPIIIEKPKLEGRPIEIRPPIQPNSPNSFY